MDVVVFPNARNVSVIPPKNIYTSEHINITNKDMEDILKFHKKQKIDNIIFRYGDPMDNGVEFYLNLLEVLDNDPKYEKTKVIIETPLISFLKRFGAWQKVIEHERVSVKATFMYGEKEASGKFFSDSNLMDAYSRFWNSFRYRPILIYYKSIDNLRYASHMERLALVLKTTLEVRDIDDEKTWATDDVFYSNDSYRYICSSAWFEDDPELYESNSDKERRIIDKKRVEIETKLKEREEKAQRQAAFRKQEDEREEATFRALRLAESMNKYKVKKAKVEIKKKQEVAKKVKEVVAKSKANKPEGLSEEQKEQLHAIRDKAVEKLNNEVVNPAKINLYDSIARHRAMNHLGC